MRTLFDILKSIPGKNINSEDFVYQHKTENLTELSVRANLDFPFFCKRILGLNGPALLNDVFHFSPIKNLCTYRYNLIIWPRGHLKTTIYDEAYIVWRLWREKNIDIATVSSAREQSEKTIENIQNMISDNEFLQHLVPKNRTDTWNKTQLNTVNGNKCYQKPFNSTSRGMHVDYLILDDILREENLSPQQVKEYFWGIFFPMVQTKKGQLLVIGTPMTAKDLFIDLEQSDMWKVMKSKCVVTNDNGDWLRPVWPERFTLEELRQIQRAQGSLIFSREYMCSPLAGGSSLFKCIKIGKHSELNKRLPTEEYYMGVDVAMQSGIENDFLAFSILGKDIKTGMIKQRKIERYKGWTEEQIIKRIKELHKIFNFKTIMVEDVGLSVGLVKQLKNLRTLPIEGLATTKKKKEEDIVSSIITGFETETLEILDNTIQYDELTAFKVKENTRTGKVTYEGIGEHDDTVIALGLAMASIMEEQEGAASFEIL